MIAAALVLLILLAGCQQAQKAPGPDGPAAPARPDQSVTAAGIVIAAGHGWSATGLYGPVPDAASCHYGEAADRYLLPDPACTPGAIDPGVTQADLARTICRPGGYSGSVRPPYRLTGSFKRTAARAYADPVSSHDAELDHLIPLGLGGASDTRNLWPQPDQGSPAQFDPGDPYGRNAKDGVEDRLHAAVCAGQINLAAAQDAIVANWTTAVDLLGSSAQG